MQPESDVFFAEKGDPQMAHRLPQAAQYHYG
jgi:hypothetical protein